MEQIRGIYKPGLPKALKITAGSFSRSRWAWRSISQKDSLELRAGKTGSVRSQRCSSWGEFESPRTMLLTGLERWWRGGQEWGRCWRCSKAIHREPFRQVRVQGVVVCVGAGCPENLAVLVVNESPLHFLEMGEAQKGGVAQFKWWKTHYF